VSVVFNSFYVWYVVYLRKASTEQKRGLEDWRRKYGLRWIASQHSQWMKRDFGEYVTANMIREITLKGFLHNLLVGTTGTA